ncbi:archaellar assembly protein FlaJ [Halobaculum sp. CBA1158]|uniref:archaellar assembly protein FlaJ n=1 Tax=Halobaculum sp. CBA1158 TaxID=2904243 RepID=UPI001F20F618|nr:archaellar assembly protein FlaJ [Halobaculum sp. CBA1158]UIP00048.1 archaellar assembly protein FlaJ [Halobaculum sp. CBA1158]
MSTNSASASDFFPDSAADLAADLLESYDALDMSKRKYVGYILAPSAAFLLLTIAGAFLLPLPLTVRLPIPALGLLVFASAVFYPKLYLNGRQVAIENQLHLVMTHMTVLSTTNIDRMEVFRTLAREEEYGAAADELARVVHLVDTWNQSLDDALRRRAKEVPSDAFSDFFDRLGYTIGAGQSLDEFLLSEQDAVIQNYITVYEGALANLEVMKDLYMSMILSMTFALVFAIVLPILTGDNPTRTVSAVIVLFMLVQLGFYVVIRAMSPHDPVWFHSEQGAPSDFRLWASFAVGVAGTAALVVFVGAGLFGYGPGLRGLLFFLENIPLALYICVPITPMAITGVMLRLEERNIEERDSEFPSFIRALGAAESAKQSTTGDVLATLHQKDFGALTPAIIRLYRRLNMRISSEESWYSFATDTRSYLIQKFSDMYLEGRSMGGRPKLLGELISQNMNTVMQLREQRRQATMTMIGLLYGITSASAFAFFIGLQVVNILADLSQQFDVTNAGGVGQIIYAGVYDIALIEFLLLLVILFNAVLSSVMIRTIDGGNKANAYLHFVLMTWLGSGVAIFTKYLVSTILTI